MVMVDTNFRNFSMVNPQRVDDLKYTPGVDDSHRKMDNLHVGWGNQLPYMVHQKLFVALHLAVVM